MVLENSLSLVKKVNRLLNWGHWFSFFNIILALAITCGYWLSEPLPETLSAWTYLILNWLGHTAFLCFIFFIITIFPVSLIFPYQRHVRGLAAILATLGLVVLIFDLYVYASLGYHIGSASFDQTIDLLRQQIVTNLRNFILIVLTVGTALFAFELTLSNFCWKKIERLKQSGWGSPLFIVFVSSFMLSHLLHIYADASLKWEITKQDNVLPLSYPATAKTFLAKYQLVDLASRAEKQLEIFSLPDTIQSNKNLTCTPENRGKSTLLLITDNLNAERKSGLFQEGFRELEQHFAPKNAPEALLNLLYGQYMNTTAAAESLRQPPGWLQHPANLLTITSRNNYLTETLPWLTENAPLTDYAIVFDPSPEDVWQQYARYEQIAIMTLTAPDKGFNLSPAQVLIRWTALQKQSEHLVTQHLDWLPTLLAQSGCRLLQQHWLGDDLLSPAGLPKLNISQQEIISFKKDKMVILRTDGSYGTWSAGTLVPLNEKLDIPMLTDALKRINLDKTDTVK